LPKELANLSALFEKLILFENRLHTPNTASQNMRGFGGFLTFLIIFKLYNGGLERWAENPHVSNAETVTNKAIFSDLD